MRILLILVVVFCSTSQVSRGEIRYFVDDFWRYFGIQLDEDTHLEPDYSLVYKELPKDSCLADVLKYVKNRNMNRSIRPFLQLERNEDATVSVLRLIFIYPLEKSYFVWRICFGFKEDIFNDISLYFTVYEDLSWNDLISEIGDIYLDPEHFEMVSPYVVD